jgi:hypothetical protein
MSLAVGCAEQAPKESAPSYADLVVIYNAEQATLDRLENKREALIAKYEAQLRPSPDKALETLSGMLDSTTVSEALSDSNEVLDPNDLLDRAVEDAQKTRDKAGELVKSLASDTEQDKEKAEKLREELDIELKALDKEIEQQKERVRRAREARDAAEAAQP